MTTRERKSDRKMGGLPLPEVVKQLLLDHEVLRWDRAERIYHVLHGEQFEARFNELRRVRIKNKASGVERPFSRMHNFFSLESGEKWARTGTKFRPINDKGYPTPELLENVALAEVLMNQTNNVLCSIVKCDGLQKERNARAKSNASRDRSGAVVNSSGRKESFARSANFGKHRADPVDHTHEANYLAEQQTLKHDPACEQVYESLHEPTYPAAMDSFLGKRRFEYPDDYYVPSHMIDAMAHRLLKKGRFDEERPNDYVNIAEMEKHEMDKYEFDTQEDQVPGQYRYHSSGWDMSSAPYHHHSGLRPRNESDIAIQSHNMDNYVDKWCDSYDVVGVKSAPPAVPYNIDNKCEFAHLTARKLSSPRRTPLPHRKIHREEENNNMGSRFDDVYEISSEGGSCQPSPEVALSLCDDSDLLPLDLGDPAMQSSLLNATHSLCAAPAAFVPPPPSVNTVSSPLDVLLTPPPSPLHLSAGLEVDGHVMLSFGGCGEFRPCDVVASPARDVEDVHDVAVALDLCAAMGGCAAVDVCGGIEGGFDGSCKVTQKMVTAVTGTLSEELLELEVLNCHADAWRAPVAVHDDWWCE